MRTIVPKESLMLWLVKRSVILGFLLLSTLVLAHATIVLGTLTADPRTPQPGEPFTLTIVLDDPQRQPVEDAYVFAEFRFGGEGDPIAATFVESATPGTYSTTLSLPQAGAYELFLRDQTFRQEETNARIPTFFIGEGENPAEFDFLFPPTAVSSASLWTWLVWLIGLPLLAAAVVTILVLRGGQPEEEEVA